MGEPCNNGGTCTDGIATYTCTCPDGFTGRDCETSMIIFLLTYYLGSFSRHRLLSCILLLDINDCQPNPCMNNGICVDGVNSFSCNCAHGFIGKHCSISKFTIFLVSTFFQQYLRRISIKEHLDINRY